MEKSALGMLGVLLLGVLIGGVASAALNGILADITVDIVPGTSSSSSDSSDSAQSTGESLVSINLGSLEAGKSYRFDDVKAYAWLNTEAGGPVTFSLEYNSTAFDYVRVEMKVYYGYDDEGEVEFYLDSSNPSYTVNLPADTNAKVEVEIKQVSVSPDAQPGQYSIQVVYSGS